MLLISGWKTRENIKLTMGSTATESVSSCEVTDPTGPRCVSNKSFVDLTQTLSASSCSVKCWHCIT